MRETPGWSSAGIGDGNGSGLRSLDTRAMFCQLDVAMVSLRRRLQVPNSQTQT